MGKGFGAVILIVAFLATGCVSQGERVLTRVTMPDGEKATIVSYNNNVPKMFLRDYAMSYIVGGESPTDKQLAAVTEVERACTEHTRIVHPHIAVTIGTYAVLFGAGGAAGGALGALAFPGAIVGQYAEYAAAAGGTFGAVYGGTINSGKNYTFQSCGRELLSRFPKYGVRATIDSPTP